MLEVTTAFGTVSQVRRCSTRPSGIRSSWLGLSGERPGLPTRWLSSRMPGSLSSQHWVRVSRTKNGHNCCIRSHRRAVCRSSAVRAANRTTCTLLRRGSTPGTRLPSQRDRSARCLGPLGVDPIAYHQRHAAGNDRLSLTPRPASAPRGRTTRIREFGWNSLTNSERPFGRACGEQSRHTNSGRGSEPLLACGGDSWLAGTGCHLFGCIPCASRAWQSRSVASTSSAFSSLKRRYPAMCWRVSRTAAAGMERAPPCPCTRASGTSTARDPARLLAGSGASGSCTAGGDRPATSARQLIPPGIGHGAPLAPPDRAEWPHPNVFPGAEPGGPCQLSM